MVLKKQFKNAKIEKKHNTYILTITYGWYYLLDYEVVFVEPTLEEAKTRLLKERSDDHIFYFDDGKEVKGL